MRSVGLNRKELFLLLNILTWMIVLLTACGSPEVSDSPISTPPTLASSLGSPLLTPTPSLVSLSLDEPLFVGATQIAGHGPAGLSIQIVDVTFGAEQIGSGIIKDDNTFDIEVHPLPEGHRIGIMLSGSLPPEMEANKNELWGDGGIQLPTIGNVYASAMTTKK